MRHVEYRHHDLEDLRRFPLRVNQLGHDAVRLQLTVRLRRPYHELAAFRLLELLDDGAPVPAAVLGGPVGFVGSAQSKQELIDNPRGLSYLMVTGRRGGSAMAAAAVNAIATDVE